MLILHSYIGFQYALLHSINHTEISANSHVRSCITDYFPKWRVPIIRKVSDWLNFLMIFVVGWGFYEFETNDVGVTEAVRKIWKA